MTVYKPQSGLGSPSSHSYAQQLEARYTQKYGQIVTPIAILKTLSVISSTFKENVIIWIITVAPSRQLKSKTSEIQKVIFKKNKLIYAGSDFTIHNLKKEYDSKLNRKTLFINDLTLLFTTKETRAKSRLIDGLGELASEGLYRYGDFDKTFYIKGWFSLIANITPSSYLRNKATLLDNTFTQRCVVVYYELTDQEMSRANLERKKRNQIQFEKFKQTLNENDVEITKEDDIRFDEYAKRWRILGAYSSSSQTFDMIKSIAIAYAILSNHTKIGSDEYRYLNMLEPYIKSPFESIKLTILELTYQGRSVHDICLMLNRDYKKYHPFVERTIKEYRMKGVLPIKPQIEVEAL